MNYMSETLCRTKRDLEMEDMYVCITMCFFHRGFIFLLIWYRPPYICNSNELLNYFDCLLISAHRVLYIYCLFYGCKASPFAIP